VPAGAPGTDRHDRARGQLRDHQRAARAGRGQLLRTIRGHWVIENRAHDVRDVTFDEDRSQLRSGAAPQAFAASKNLAIALLRRRGWANIAEAVRCSAGRPRCAVALIATAGMT
jgi:predicted transposase YbfD/YdcC